MTRLLGFAKLSRLKIGRKSPIAMKQINLLKQFLISPIAQPHQLNQSPKLSELIALRYFASQNSDYRTKPINF